MSANVSDTAVQRVRRFNRFYTQQIGLLRKGFLQSELSLLEVRVLYELANNETYLARDLVQNLGLDAGYVSRMLRNFEKRGLVKRTAAPHDGRQTFLFLTEKGKQTFAPLDQRQNEQLRALLAPLTPAEREEVAAAMETITQRLGEPAKKRSWTLRSHRPGDMGWVVYRHGVLYSQEYGYNEHFEALVAKVVWEFLDTFDPERDRCWIAEQNGDIVGSVFLVGKPPEDKTKKEKTKSRTIAKLRLLLVEPSARGQGIGERLVSECVKFAREAGYKKIVLWTQSELVAARSLYKRAGFKIVEQEKHSQFGVKSVAETWELEM